MPLPAAVAKNELVTLDFETYYGPNYTLSGKGMTMVQYVRDERFLPHCLCASIGPRKKKYQLKGEKAIANFLKDLDPAKTSVLAQNTAFDAAILGWRFGFYANFYLDTLSMARALHGFLPRLGLDRLAEYYGYSGKIEGALLNTYGKQQLSANELNRLVEYCWHDVELCRDIGMRQIEVFPERELELIDMTLRMFVEPALLLDEERARAAHKWEVEERLRQIVYSGVDEKTLSSSDKFAAALRAVGCEPPTKTSKTTGDETYAFAQTDEAFLALLEHDDIRVVRLVEGRLAAKSKLNQTRAERLLAIGGDGGTLPVMLNYSGAKTHRWSGGDKLNFQNFPRIERDDKGNPVPNTGELRQSLIAPPGHVILVVDAAQIEARYLAYLAGQMDILDAFAAGKDVYALKASDIYGRPISKKTDPLERFIGKVAVLGLGYKMGALRLQKTLALGIMGPAVDLPMEQCNKIVNGYRKSNREIVKLWNEADRVMIDMATGKSGDVKGILEYEGDDIWLPNGLSLQFPNLTGTFDDNGNFRDIYYMWKGAKSYIYNGLMVENWIQALARVDVADKMLEIKHEYAKIKLRAREILRVVLMTHDEVVSVVPERLAEKLLKMNIGIMRVPPSWAPGIPLDAEGGYSREYSK